MPTSAEHRLNPADALQRAMILAMQEKEKGTPESRAADMKEISNYVSQREAQQKASSKM